MKHLLASCAVIALMAAPALAQSTYQPTEPVDPTAVPEVMVDPETTDDADVQVDATVESESDVSVTMEPDTYAEDEVTAEEDAVAEAEPEEDTDVAESDASMSEDPVVEAADAEVEDDAEVVTAAAESEADVEAPIDTAELPAEYSTDDLNALMLAQLNQDAEEIAMMVIEPTEDYAAADTAMTSDSYASTESMADSSEVDTYASGETTTEVSPEETVPETDTYASTDTTTSSEMEADTYASTEMETPADTAADTYADATVTPESATDEPDAYASTETDTTTEMPADTEAETYADAGTDTYVTPESETDALPETDMAMADTAEADEPATQEYADNGANMAPDTDMVPDEAPVMPESTTLSEPVDPVLGESKTATDMAMNDDTMSSDETADGAGESFQVAEQSDESALSAEGDIDQNAVEIAQGDSRFSTLVELVGLAGLEDEFSAEGPYTVFAPTNDAFAALPEETLARLRSAEGKEELTEILKAHVVDGAVMADKVPLAGESVETLAATSVNVSGSTDGTLNIAGTTHTIGDGIYASNGVVYPIDAVILPEATPEPVVTPEN